MDVVRKLILERLEELGLTMSEVSLKIGKNHAYLQQFLKRGHPLELPEKSRIPLAALLDVPENALRGPSSSPLPTRPRNQNIDRQFQREDNRSAQQHRLGTQNFLDNVRPLNNMTGRELPVFGTAQGGADGALIVTENPVDWTSMPDFLARVDGAYGMIVSGDSMDPEMKSGSTALVNPHLPPRSGDTCIFRCHKDDGEVRAMVKQLVRYNDTTWYVHQHNPKKDFALKRADWQICHVTVENYSRR